MKILMITSTYEPIIGGTETLIKNIVTGLNNKGIHTDVLTLNMDKMWMPKKTLDVVNNGNFTTYRISAINPFINNRLSNTLGGFLKIHVVPNLICRNIFNNYDLLHFHGEVDMIFFLLSQRIKKPKLFQYHSIHAINPNNMSYYIYKFNPLYRYLLQKEVSYHISNSKHAIGLLSGLGIDPKKIKIIPNPIDIQRFSNPSTINISNYPELAKNIIIDAKKILCLGRLIPSKSGTIKSAINAMPIIAKQIADVQLIIGGDGPLRQEITDLANKINQKLNYNSIIVVGEIPSVDIPSILNLSDIVIGIGQVPIEAMASSKSVIVAGHMKGPFGGNFGGIITKENVDALKNFNFSGRNSKIQTTPERIANAAIELLSDNEYRNSIGEFGKNYIKQELNIEIYLEELYSIYNKCTNVW